MNRLQYKLYEFLVENGIHIGMTELNKFYDENFEAVESVYSIDNYALYHEENVDVLFKHATEHAAYNMAETLVSKDYLSLTEVKAPNEFQRDYRMKLTFFKG